MNLKNKILSAIIILFACGSIHAESDPNRFDPFLGTDWYGVYLQGSKAGYAEMSFEKVDAPLAGWRTRESATLIINALGKTDTMKIIESRFFTSPGGELYSLESEVSSFAGKMTVEGVKESDEFIITISLGGQETKKVFDYPVDYLDNYKSPNIKIADGLVDVGDSINSSYFDPTPPLTGMVHKNMKIESVDEYNFAGVSTNVYTAGFTIPEMKFSGISIFDKAGRELETNLGGGIILKLEGREQAIKIDEEFDLLANNLIRPQQKLENPTALQSLELKIIGISKDDIIDSELQRITAESENELLADIERAAVPDNVMELPVKSEELAQYLSPTVYIQSDAREIKELAAEIVGDERNSWEAAKKINRWVYENIDKQFTPDFSNALQTLRTKQGDCGEHTALTVALMRAAGIPARPVTGLVYWPPGEGFGYHAWVEAYVGQWVMMDPSWGEDIVNPTHIALTTGDIVDQASILSRVMGKMGIEVVQAR